MDFTLLFKWFLACFLRGRSKCLSPFSFFTTWPWCFVFSQKHKPDIFFSSTAPPPSKLIIVHQIWHLCLIWFFREASDVWPRGRPTGSRGAAKEATMGAPIRGRVQPLRKRRRWRRRIQLQVSLSVIQISINIFFSLMDRQLVTIVAVVIVLQPMRDGFFPWCIAVICIKQFLRPWAPVKLKPAFYVHKSGTSYVQSCQLLTVCYFVPFSQLHKAEK